MLEHCPAMTLVLEDGTVFQGQGFGACHAVTGEVVFNTAMTGYVESLTDPSYRSQILALTYPLVGNYGVPAPRIAGSLARPYESDRIQPEALVVQSYVPTYSHRRAIRSLGDWLAAEGVVGISGVDTRALTLRLRDVGTLRGWVLPSGMELDDAKRATMALAPEAIVRAVAPRDIVRHAGGPLTVLVIDAGAKDNIVRCLLERGASVIRAPYHARLGEIAREADGIVIGNGPGDPKALGALVEQTRLLLSRFEGPMFGICLGNQILALAAGGDTYKLPYGHRGVNQPVQDLLSRRCYVTSQNHGYAVREESLPGDWEPWFVNVNDGTNEGIRARARPFFSVQFHPEASPGPEDVAFLFDDYMRLVGSMARGRR